MICDTSSFIVVSLYKNSTSGFYTIQILVKGGHIHFRVNFAFKVFWYGPPTAQLRCFTLKNIYVSIIVIKSSDSVQNIRKLSSLVYFRLLVL